MCNFFSFVSDGHGKVYYFDYTIRKQILSGKLDYELESHTSIADYFGFKGEKEDILNKWEYNPLTGELICDQLNTLNDRELIKDFVNNLNINSIVPELIIKPIINPFTDIQTGACLPNDIKLLKKWASVRDSIKDSCIWGSVRDSTRNSIEDSIIDSISDSVDDSVWNSIRDSISNSVDEITCCYIWDSGMDSVNAYTSSFFNLKAWEINGKIKKKNPFQPCIDLWERGLVPSFDGNKWRLHGVKGKILWEGII